MTNPLTGDYDAVVEIAIRQINGLLASLHQESASDDPALKLLHSASIRIGDMRRRPPDVEVFGDWLLEYHKSGPSRGLGEIRNRLSKTAPPGAAKRLADEFVRFDDNWVVQQPPAVVRGLAKLQLSSPTLSIPTGSTSEVTLHAHVRGAYYPDANTTDLPSPIHGEVRASFGLRQVPGTSGPRLLIEASADDDKIQFIAASGSGLNVQQESLIAAQVREVVRGGLSLLPVDLPAGFPFSEFKGLGSGANEVIALPLQLSGAPAPPTGSQPITQSFVGSSGFAFAVRKEYVNGLVDTVAIREAIANRPPLVVRLQRFGLSIAVSYRLRFTIGPNVTFKNGAIEISGRVAVETSTWWAPNGFVEFTQPIRLVLNAIQDVTIGVVGEPDVTQSAFIPPSIAVVTVKTEIQNALVTSPNPQSPSPVDLVRRVFDDAKTNLVEVLQTFDSSASALYTSVAITPDGVVVSGDISGASRRGPVVDIRETHQGTAFSALDSWIPGGRITRLTWSWIEYSGLGPSTIVSGVEKSVSDEHRFILPKPPTIANTSQICLQLEGTQVQFDGSETPIAAGDVCQVQEPEFTIDLPSWWEPLTMPVFLPDISADISVREAVAGHVTVTTPPGNREDTQNSLVYFVDWQSDGPLVGLRNALTAVEDARSIVLVAVLPSVAFDSRRQTIEGQLASVGERFVSQLRIVEDIDGGWSRTFGIAKLPAAYLINARREFVWKHEGDLEPAVLAAALKTHLLPPATRRFRPVRSGVATGDRAPDITFQDEGRNQYALHRLHGRRVVLNFWQSWSAPCLNELRRLQSVHEQKGGPFVVGFHGGKDPKAMIEIRKRLGLSFTLIQDAEQRIAGRYGVRCWPTTIAIDREGRVEHVQFGISHGHHGRHGRGHRHQG